VRDFPQIIAVRRYLASAKGASLSLAARAGI